MVDRWSSCVCRHYLLEGRCFSVESTEVKASLLPHFILFITLHHNGLNDLECTTSDTYSLQQRKIRQLQILVLRESVLANINATQIYTVRHPQSTTSSNHSSSHDNHSLQRFQSIQFQHRYSIQRIDSNCQILYGLLLIQYHILLLCYLEIRYPQVFHITWYSVQLCLIPNHIARWWNLLSETYIVLKPIGIWSFGVNWILTWYLKRIRIMETQQLNATVLQWRNIYWAMPMKTHSQIQLNRSSDSFHFLLPQMLSAMADLSIHSVNFHHFSLSLCCCSCRDNHQLFSD